MYLKSGFVEILPLPTVYAVVRPHNIKKGRTGMATTNISE